MNFLKFFVSFQDLEQYFLEHGEFGDLHAAEAFVPRDRSSLASSSKLPTNRRLCRSTVRKLKLGRFGKF